MTQPQVVSAAAKSIGLSELGRFNLRRREFGDVDSRLGWRKLDGPRLRRRRLGYSN